MQSEYGARIGVFNYFFFIKQADSPRIRKKPSSQGSQRSSRVLRTRIIAISNLDHIEEVTDKIRIQRTPVLWSVDWDHSGNIKSVLSFFTSEYDQRLMLPIGSLGGATLVGFRKLRRASTVVGCHLSSGHFIQAPGLVLW